MAGASELIEHMSAWLRLSAPANVLVPVYGPDPPVRKAPKQPMIAHKDGRWTWARYDDFRRQHPEHVEYGVLLQTLCVVDFDDGSIVDAWEVRFPALRLAPMETTSKGRHYFFERSPLADTGAYFDGARQVGAVAVDFKSRTSTGTGGVLVMCPSAGRSWVRAPWTCEISAIPDDLLAAVAAPKGTKKRDSASASATPASASRRPAVASVASVAATAAAPGPPVSAELLRRVVASLSDRRATGYSDWFQVLFAVRNVCADSGLLDSCRDIAHEFSRRCPSKYDPSAVDKKLEEAARGCVGKPLGMGSLMLWVGEDDPPAKRAICSEAREELRGYGFVDDGDGEHERDGIVGAASLDEVVDVRALVEQLQKLDGLGGVLADDTVFSFSPQCISFETTTGQTGTISRNSYVVTLGDRVVGNLVQTAYLENTSLAYVHKLIPHELHTWGVRVLPQLLQLQSRDSPSITLDVQNAWASRGACIDVNTPNRAPTRVTKTATVADLRQRCGRAIETTVSNLYGITEAMFVVNGNNNNTQINMFGCSADAGRSSDAALAAQLRAHPLPHRFPIVSITSNRFYVCRAGVWVEVDRGFASDNLRKVFQRNDALWGALQPADRKYIESAVGAGAILSASLEDLSDASFPSKLDSADGILAFDNGLLDISCGAFRAFSPDDLVSKTAGYDYVPKDAVADDDVALINAFYDVVFPQPDERELFLRTMGYALCGRSNEKYFMILTDVRDGNNGRSTLMDALVDVFGALSAPTQINFLYSSRNEGDANSHGANELSYAGKRIAVFDETDKNRKFDINKIKRLTGGGVRIGARGCGDKTVTNFKWTAFILIACNQNNFPQIDATDVAFVRRMIALPMRSRFVERVVVGSESLTFAIDLDMKQKLERAKLAHLHVLLEAYDRYAREGLPPMPQACIDFKKQVVMDADPLLSAVEEFVVDKVEFDLQRGAEQRGIKVLGFIRRNDIVSRFCDAAKPRAKKADIKAAFDSAFAARGVALAPDTKLQGEREFNVYMNCRLC